MPSSLEPSTDTLRPSKVELVVTAPVKAPPDLGKAAPPRSAEDFIWVSIRPMFVLSFVPQVSALAPTSGFVKP